MFPSRPSQIGSTVRSSNSNNSLKSTNQVAVDTVDQPEWAWSQVEQEIVDLGDDSNLGLVALLSEALDSKRNARERLLRAIAMELPEVARALQVQVPVANCGDGAISSPAEPLSEFVLARLPSPQLPDPQLSNSRLPRQGGSVLR